MMAHSLDWNDWQANPIALRPYDLIIGADIVWLEKLVLPLCFLLKHIAEANKCEVLISHQTRSKRVDQLLFKELGKAFVVSSVDLHDFPDVGELKVLKLMLRSQSA